MDGLSTICAGLGIVEEDDNEKRTGYAKGEYCLGASSYYSYHFLLIYFNGNQDICGVCLDDCNLILFETYWQIT